MRFVTHTWLRYKPVGLVTIWPYLVKVQTCESCHNIAIFGQVQSVFLHSKLEHFIARVPSYTFYPQLS